MRYALTFMLVLFALTMPRPAHADCTLVPNGTDILAPETRPEGSLVYNQDHNVIQSCENGRWVAMRMNVNGRGLLCAAPPATCTNPGDACPDGSLFVGYMAYDGACQAAYAADTDQGTSLSWGIQGATTATADPFDGRKNQQWIVDNTTLSNYPAFEACANLDRHGHQDWYLPAVIEALGLLAANKDVLGLGNVGFWTSTDYGAITNYALYMATDESGSSGGVWRNNGFYVRCIRRG
jgi:hypothetical protein